MVVSANAQNDSHDFNILLSSTINTLNYQAKKSSSKFKTLAGNKLEPYVRDLMADLAIGTPFEDTIQLISGQRFPDIVARKYFGVEVKTTTGNHWKTTGNSVLESTRVEDIERIFMLFGKLGAPVEFRSRPYEECLSEVVVTHSPRYQIDMELSKGNTIFDKMKIPYNELRTKDNPIKPIVSYYKSKLRPGEDIWWMDTESENKVIIRVWNSLSSDERNKIKIKAMIYFPELFSSSILKYDNIPAWLVKTEGVVCKNIRDLFTAGGQVDISTPKKIYHKMPRILSTLYNNIGLIYDYIDGLPADKLSEYWKVRTTEKNKFNDWLQLIVGNINSVIDKRTIDVKKVLLQKLEIGS